MDRPAVEAPVSNLYNEPLCPVHGHLTAATHGTSSSLRSELETTQAVIFPVFPICSPRPHTICLPVVKSSLGQMNDVEGSPPNYQTCGTPVRLTETSEVQGAGEYEDGGFTLCCQAEVRPSFPRKPLRGASPLPAEVSALGFLISARQPCLLLPTPGPPSAGPRQGSILL